MARLLVIEDEALLRSEIANWLTLEDYDVTEASDGVKGIQLAAELVPDLVICDVTMPGLDGYGVLLELRSNFETAHIPFIFVTARAAHEDIRKGMDLGADDYITKPFTHAELIQAVRTRLDKKAFQMQQYEQQLIQWQHAFEDEQEKHHFRSKLIAMFSHDFRTPLAGIMTSNSLLRDYYDRMEPDRRKTHFGRVESYVRQLTQMLDDLLIVAQMESGSLEFIPQMRSIDELLRDIVDEFQVIHSETCHITLHSNYFGDFPVDTRLIRQIVSNLISNAIKYSPKNGEVNISLQGDAKQIGMTVQDYGIGIPDADKARMFTAFQRASNVGEIKGTGLGLAIVKQAVDLHGGTIDLESKVGQGTIITVTLTNGH